MIRGIGASEGISIGKVFKYDHIEVIAEKNEVEDTALEIERFQKGLTESIVDLTGIKDYAEENINAETAAILKPILKYSRIRNLPPSQEVILSEGINGEYGLEKVTHQFVSMFENMDNEYLENEQQISKMCHGVCLCI